MGGSSCFFFPSWLLLPSPSCGCECENLFLYSFIRLNWCFSTTVQWHTSVQWDNIRCTVKNYPISPNWSKNNNVALPSGCAFKGMWGYFPPSVPSRISFVCVQTGPDFTLSENKLRHCIVISRPKGYHPSIQYPLLPEESAGGQRQGDTLD